MYLHGSFTRHGVDLILLFTTSHPPHHSTLSHHPLNHLPSSLTTPSPIDPQSHHILSFSLPLPLAPSWTPILTTTAGITSTGQSNACPTSLLTSNKLGWTTSTSRSLLLLLLLLLVLLSVLLLGGWCQSKAQRRGWARRVRPRAAAAWIRSVRLGGCWRGGWLWCAGWLGWSRSWRFCWWDGSPLLSSLGKELGVVAAAAAVVVVMKCSRMGVRKPWSFEICGWMLVRSWDAWVMVVVLVGRRWRRPRESFCQCQRAAWLGMVSGVFFDLCLFGASGVRGRRGY